MTPRLTAPQMDVLRALDKLPEGEWVTAKDGGFNTTAAFRLAYSSHPKQLVFCSAYELPKPVYMLTPAGRSLIAKLKAEGQW